MEDKELKKKLAKIPDIDENGDPIYKIDNEIPNDKVAEKDSDSSFLEDTVISKGNV